MNPRPEERCSSEDFNNGCGHDHDKGDYCKVDGCPHASFIEQECPECFYTEDEVAKHYEDCPLMPTISED